MYTAPRFNADYVTMLVYKYIYIETQVPRPMHDSEDGHFQHLAISRTRSILTGFKWMLLFEEMLTYSIKENNQMHSHQCLYI